MEDDDMTADMTAEEVNAALDALEDEIGLPNGLPPLSTNSYYNVVREGIGRRIAEDIDRRMMENAFTATATIDLAGPDLTLYSSNSESTVSLNASEYVLLGEQWYCPEHGKIESQYVTFMVDSQEVKFCLKCYIEKIESFGVHKIMSEEQYKEHQKEYEDEVRSIKP